MPRSKATARQPKKRKQADEDEENGAAHGVEEKASKGTYMPKKRAKQPAHEATVVLIDVGSTSASKDAEGVSDLEHSKQVADWVLSRKIFTESADRFSLVFFGHETTLNDDYPNIYVHNDEPDTAKIEMLQVLEKEVRTNAKTAGDYTSALIAGLETLRVYCENTPTNEITGKTIVLLSNLSGLDDPTAATEILQPIITGFKKLGVELIVVGPDLSTEPETKAQEVGFGFVKSLLDEVPGTAFSFHQGLQHLKFFIPKGTQPRGQPFNLQLAPDYAVKVQMYVKNQRASMKFKWDIVATDDPNKHLKKVRQFETAPEEIQIRLNQIDQTEDEAFTGTAEPVAGRKVDKEDVIKGYRYGKSLIPFGPADEEMLAFEKEGKQLQLVQFTKRENILPQFILSNARYYYPDARDKDSQVAMMALVKAMIDSETMALCRYAYNVIANPKLSVLIPKITSEGLPKLIHYILPFSEDLRLYQFPELERIGRAPNDYQMDLVDNYIDAMMLVDDPENPQKEFLRPRDVMNPKHQHQCQVLRHKAMHPDEPFPEIDRDALLAVVSPPRELLDKAKPVIDLIKEHFTLEPFPSHYKAFESAYASTTKDAFVKMPRIETVAGGKMEEAESSAGIKRDADAKEGARDDWDDENWGADMKL